MSQANDNITVTPGAGATVATHLINTKEYQAIVPCNEHGHIVGSEPAYIVQTPASALAQNKYHLVLFNGAGSGKIIKVKALFAQKNFAAVTGVAWELDINWITSAGSGGTALSIKKLDQDNANAPAQIVATYNPTSPTENTSIFNFIRWLHSEETNVAAQIQEALPIWPAITLPHYAGDLQDLILREGQGITCKQITATTVGTYYFGALFTLV